MKRIPLCLTITFGLALLNAGLSAFAQTATELLRQGVIAEETGAGTGSAQQLYRQAAAVGEQQRLATATALYRLGELEWRQGQTNDAVRTWRLLTAQYGDQTNLLQLVSERAPIVPATLSAAARSTLPGSPTSDDSPLARAAAQMGQLNTLPKREWAKWLVLQGVTTPELTRLLSIYNMVLGALESSQRNYQSLPADHPQKAEAEMRIKQSSESVANSEHTLLNEAASIVEILRLQTTSTTTPANLSPLARAAAQFSQLPDLTAEEWPVWLTLQGLATPGLAELIQRRLTIQDQLAGVSDKYGPDHPERQSLERRQKLNEMQIVQESQEIVSLLRKTGKASSIELKQTRDVSPESDLSPEEATELARVKRMLRDSPDLLAATTSPSAPLTQAAAQGHLQVLEFLLANRVPLAGGGALCAAAREGQQAAVKKLLAAGADPNDTFDSWPPLASAILRRHQRVIETLLTSGANPNIAFKNQGSAPLPEHWRSQVWTSDTTSCPVHLAAAIGSLDALQLLVKSGADLNATNSNGASALHFAVALQDELLVRYLLSKKVEINGDSNVGTPLVMASPGVTSEQGFKIFELLLAAKADPNRYSSISRAPLWTATWLNNPEAVEQLVRSGARVDLVQPGNYPATLLEIGLQNYRIGQPVADPIALSRNRNQAQRVFQALFKAGARQPTSRPRLLSLAVDTEDAELVALALRAGEKPDEATDPQPPLYTAVRTSRRNVELLLEAGADPNRRIAEKDVESPFQLAQEQVGQPLFGIIQPPPSRPGYFSLPNEDRLAILDLLTRKGGRPLYSDAKFISFTSALTNIIVPQRRRSPVSVEREVRLCELLNSLLLRELIPGEENKTLMPWYPDLKGAYLWNDLDRTQPPRRRAVDLAALIEAGDFGKTLRLEWGDILVVSTRISESNREPFILTNEQSKQLSALQSKKIVVKFGDTAVVAILSPGVWSQNGKPHFSPAFVNYPDDPTQSAVLPGTEFYHFAKNVSQKYGGFHGRFRLVRRGEPGPLDQTYQFNASLNGSRNSAKGDGGLDGSDFQLQDGDEVTFYPLPKP